MNAARALTLATVACLLASCAADPVGTSVSSTGTASPDSSSRSGPPTSQSSGSSVSIPLKPSPASSASADPHEAATVRHIDTAFAATPVFPGATKLNSSPDPQLDDPFNNRPPTYVQHTGWWASPMNPDQFHTWLNDHIPASWSLLGGNPDTPSTWGNDGSLEQFSAEPRSDAIWTYSAVNVYWAPASTGTSIRVTAQADWVATRLTAETVDTAANTVDVTVFIHDPAFTNSEKLPPTVRRTLHGADVATLRATVNSLNPWTDTGIHGCLANFGMTDTLKFTGGGTTTTLTAHSGGCAGTSFVSKSRSFPDLEDSVLHGELVKLLELPDSYTQYW